MDSPAAVKRGALAAVAGAHGGKGEVRLESVKPAGKNVIARIAGIADRSAAEALRGQLIEVDRSALPPLEEGEYYHADLIGLPCVDRAGAHLGRVVAVENFGAGDL